MDHGFDTLSGSFFLLLSPRYQVTPRASTLARDYRCPAVPDTPRDVYAGHSAGVKCVTFVGEEAVLMASGSGDGEIKLWPTNPPSDGDSSDCDSRCGSEESVGARAEDRRLVDNDNAPQDARNVGSNSSSSRSSIERFETEEGGGDVCRGGGGVADAAGSGGGSRNDDSRVGSKAISPVLTLSAVGMGNERARVWDVASNRQGNLLASASGDGAVRLWSLPSSDQLLSSEGAKMCSISGSGGD